MSGSAMPDLVKRFHPGDILVAGRNFGCGSSREHAVMTLKGIGVGAILAESFGRIFFRNAINLGLPALTAPDLADMIRYGKMPQMNMASGCEYNYPEFQDYIRKADVVSVQIGSNDAFVPCIVALGNATNWKSEKLAATILAGDLRNEGSGSTMSAIYRSIKAMDLTKAERDATWNLLFSGMSKICDETYPKTTAALISIVQEIRNLNPDAQIILVGYTNPVPLIPCWRSYFNKLNKFEKQIAKTYNLTYVAIPNTETTLDVHPTIKGHQYIANKLVNAIENP